MDSTHMLMHEHRIIEKMLNVLSNYSRKLEQGGTVQPERLKACVDFIRTFADTCHHAKEEGVLFAEMETHGMPRNGGPVGVMLAEHEMGRGYVKGMAKAIDDYEKGDAGAGKEFAKNARGYIGLLSQHINKEDNILYPMAEDMLSDMDQELVGRFEEIEKRLGEGVHERYEKIVDQLERDSGS
ncbi:MAG: hemerythrin domain-containing protein [Deltaproteobacteria bacterium]|nr:hemerythrin domain-containing protein [Deltaproteobacteria bacterium]MCL5277793.1 hemerythrin domain-containing protein [Deltaproteobacteria bacterium]